MNGNAFDLAESLHREKLTYILSSDLKNNFQHSEINLNFNNWSHVKYLNDDSSEINLEVGQIPNNTGGLYLFYLPCHILPSITEFPFYIGRAKKTDNQNLRKRIKEYFQHYSNDKERPKIYRMLRVWGAHLRVAYYPIESNSEIETIEKDMINSLVLPMNDKIPDITISNAVKAFQP